jgi:TctA family transporter
MADAAMWIRRSPVLSECIPTITITTAATTYGTADVIPSNKFGRPDRVLSALGSHRLIPYVHVFSPK